MWVNREQYEMEKAAIILRNKLKGEEDSECE